MGKTVRPWGDVVKGLNPLAWQAGTSWAWNTKIELWTGSGEMEALSELFFDNLATLLGTTGSAVGHIGWGLVAASWRDWGPAGYKQAIAAEWERIYFEWHIPACGVGLAFGNIWFAWLATRLATKENRTDVTAQPYGMNTTVIYIALYAMTLPALEQAHDKFMPAAGGDINAAAKKAAEFGWKVSVATNFIVGMFEICGFFLGDLIRYLLPTASVYIPLAGVGFVWLAFSPMLDIAKEPIMCLLPLIVVMVGFFGNTRYPIVGKFTFPIAVLAIGISTITGWAGACEHSTKAIPYGYSGATTSVASAYNGNYPSGEPKKTCQGTDSRLAKAAWEDYAFTGDVMGGFGKGLEGLSESDILDDWVPSALLFGMIGFLGTMTCVESAEAAGDAYPMSETMIVDGIGTCMVSLFGGFYGTTVYIGHPVHKQLGAKIGYSMFNGLIYLFLLCSGMFAGLYNVIPGCANGAILVFVGLVISRQAFEKTPARHYPCLLLGLMPYICNWAKLESQGNASYFMGVQMLGPAGGVVCGMGLTTIGCFAFDRRFMEATLFSVIAIFLSLFGIFASHNDLVDPSNGVMGLTGRKKTEYETLGVYAKDDKDVNNGWRWAIGWTLCAAYFAVHIPLQKMGILHPPIPEENDNEDPYDVGPDPREKTLPS